MLGLRFVRYRSTTETTLSLSPFSRSMSSVAFHGNFMFLTSIFPSITMLEPQYSLTPTYSTEFNKTSLVSSTFLDKTISNSTNQFFSQFRASLFNQLDNLWDGILQSSTMKKRRAKMNKHKLRKRSKKLRYNTKPSRR